MARINIEQKWWSDPRRAKLGQLLGNPYLVESSVVYAWRLAQEHWEKGELIPGHIYVSLLGAYELLQANLACLHENQDPNSSKIPTPVQHIASTDPTGVQRVQTEASIIQQGYIYVRGSREFLSWGMEIRQKRVVAGQISAQRPRDARGRLLSKSTETQQITNTTPTNTNIVQLSGSGSGSGSGSTSSSRSIKNTCAKKTKDLGIRQEYPDEFELLWRAYDKKGEKKKSFEVWKTLKLSGEETEILCKAIRNHKKERPVKTYRPDFQRFLETDWREQANLVLDDPHANGEIDWSQYRSKAGPEGASNGS